MGFKKIVYSCLLGLATLSADCLSAKSQAIWYNREEITDDALTSMVTINYDRSSFLYGRNGSYSQTKGLTVFFDSSPFSDVGFGSVLSGYARFGVINPNSFTEDIKPVNDLAGVHFSNGSMMSFEGGLQVGTQIGNRSRTFFALPHLNIGLNYNTKNSITAEINDRFALKAAVGMNFMVTGHYLSSPALKNCFLLMRNDFSVDSRQTLTKYNRIVTDPTKRWVFNNSLAVGVNF